MTRKALKIISSDSDAQPSLYIDPKMSTVHQAPALLKFCLSHFLGHSNLFTSLLGPWLGLSNLVTMICKVRMWAPAREIFLEQKPNHDTLLLKTSPYIPLP